MSFVRFFVLVVQALALEVIFGGCARFVCRGWEGSLLSFSPWMRILRPSSLKWYYIGCVYSMSCTGVVFMAPNMTRRAMFWTLSSLLLLALTAVPHEVDAYSIVGRTVAVYTLVRNDESAPQVVPASFLIKASFFRLLLSIFSICDFQVSPVSSFTPRKVGVFVWARSHHSATVLSVLFRGKGEVGSNCFANIYPEALVQCPLHDTTDGFLA